MDPKWSVIAMKAKVTTGLVSALAWALFDYASQNKPRGSVEGFDPETYAVYSGFPEDEILAALQAMRDKKIIGEDNILTNWAKRQPQREDDSYFRVQKHRALKELINTDTDKDKEESNIVTQCNADVTQAPPLDAFETMQRMVEKMTGYPTTQKDIASINEFIKRGVTEADIQDALSFLDGVKVARGAADLSKSVFVSVAKRTQAANKKPGNGKYYPPPAPEPSPEDIAEMRRITAELKAKHA